LQLAELIGVQPKLFGDFADTYKNIASFSNKAVTVQNVLAAQNALRTNGFSPELVQVFALLNVDSATQELILQDLLALDPNEIAADAENFPDSLTDPSFITSLNNTSLALKQGVTGVTPTPVPEPSFLPGILIFGSGVTWYKLKRRKQLNRKLPKTYS
jgi:hypothetical protein